jgi:chorismate synthase
MKIVLLLLAIFFINPVISQITQRGYASSNYGTRNKASDKNSFKYGLVSAIIRRVPSAKKVSDRFGNSNVSLRGRNSVQTAGDEVLWDIDGVTYISPPMMSINEVVYVEVIKGLAAANKYGSDGAAGVIIVKTSVSASNNGLINSPKNLWRTVTEKRIRIKKN